MTEQQAFFSSNHNRLLSIATWSRYLAWVVLVIYILAAPGVYIQEQNRQVLSNAIPSHYLSFSKLLADNQLYAFSVFVEIASTFLKGIVSFLVLKGISLGLNMIVETDINYREQKGGAQ